MSQRCFCCRGTGDTYDGPCAACGGEPAAADIGTLHRVQDLRDLDLYLVRCRLRGWVLTNGNVGPDGVVDDGHAVSIFHLRDLCPKGVEGQVGAYRIAISFTPDPDLLPEKQP